MLIEETDDEDQENKDQENNDHTNIEDRSEEIDVELSQLAVSRKEKNLIDTKSVQLNEDAVWNYSSEEEHDDNATHDGYCLYL